MAVVRGELIIGGELKKLIKLAWIALFASQTQFSNKND